MGFSGAPEIINGRLAMLGFVAALGAELSTGESVLTQLADEPTLIALTFVLFSAASLVPAFARRKSDPVGPFTPQAEMTNGRAAILLAWNTVDCEALASVSSVAEANWVKGELEEGRKEGRKEGLYF
eukprot:1147336-Pelagomonas_calceolata.AAC.1